MARNEWQKARRQDPVRRRGADAARAPKWMREEGPAQSRWYRGSREMNPPTCPGTVAWAVAGKNDLAIEWQSERGRRRRVHLDRIQFVLDALRRGGVRFDRRGPSYVAIPEKPLAGGAAPGIGAAWKLEPDDDGLWWLTVARARMPVDAFVWGVLHDLPPSNAD